MKGDLDQVSPAAQRCWNLTKERRCFRARAYVYVYAPSVGVLHLRRRADLSDPINGKLGQVATIVHSTTSNIRRTCALVSHLRIYTMFIVIIIIIIVIVTIIVTHHYH